MLSADELRAQLTGAIDALDALIPLMGCQLTEEGVERRWRSGACEILPLAPS